MKGQLLNVGDVIYEVYRQSPTLRITIDRVTPKRAYAANDERIAIPRILEFDRTVLTDWGLIKARFKIWGSSEWVISNQTLDDMYNKTHKTV